MMRKLAIALSLVSAMGTGTANALGLGEATVHSSLNQPLRAEIELVNIRDLEKSEILPALASREEFAKAKIDRLYFLSDIRFQVTKNKRGNTVIELSTTRPVREPYLNFLVEVIWPSGRLLREYAMLIDPPLFSQGAQSTPSDAVSPAISMLPDIEVLDENDALMQEQTGDVSYMDPSAATPFVPPNSVPATSYATSYTTSDTFTGDTYGPTGKSDTLWAIALKVRPDKRYSPQQVMLAIQDLNPDAFSKGNINLLKSGKILRLPDSYDIEARTRSQAIQDVIVQNRAFETGRDLSSRQIDSTLGPVSSRTSRAVSNKSDGSELKIVVAPDEQTDDAESGAHAGKSRVGGGSAVEENLAVTLEKLDRAEVENDELASRVRDLEDQLQTLQRLLTLKDDELADMQRQFGQVTEAEDNAAGTTSDQALTDTESPANPAGKTSLDSSATDSPVDEGAVEDASSEAGVAEDGTLEDGAVIGEGNGEEGEVTADEGAQGAELASSSLTGAVDESGVSDAVDDAGSAPVLPDQAVNTPEPAVSEPEPPAREPGLVDTIMGNPLYLGGGIAGALVLVLGLIGLFRRDAKKDRDFHESLAIDAETEEQIDLGFADAEEDAVSQISQKGVSDDPVSEADVYIAYGRFDQAVTVLEAAVSEEPGRSDIRLKLLEVYKESGDNEAFFKQYREIEALDDEEALAAADELSLGMVRPVDDDPEISIDDLENELLSSGVDGSTGTGRKIGRSIGADDELNFELDESVDPFQGRQVQGEEETLFDLRDENELAEDNQLHSRTPDSGRDALLEEDIVTSSDVVDVSLENDFENLESDLDLNREDSISLDSVKQELEGVSSILTGETEKDRRQDPDLEDLDDLELDEDLSLEDLDAEINAEMDLVNERIDHEEGSDTVLPGNDDELELLDSGDELELNKTLDLKDLENDDELKELEISEVLGEGFSLDHSDDGDRDSAATKPDSEVSGSLDAQVDENPVDQAGEVEDDEDFDFLSGADEVETKLDLARAYIDMGDMEGARDILDEVVIEGNEDQKLEARQLMKGLD
ncbi:MAG: hypothetical protein CSA52_03915 [Gammaproteobacteria bacterium]|nr:MAG: hypothetical protein CSB48_10640 [Pseudomonadota bacterium]PIE38024.1 MAG: hypothetical protein CSA52_03915 [Gammaproteobacteria bacterium]